MSGGDSHGEQALSGEMSIGARSAGANALRAYQSSTDRSNLGLDGHPKTLPRRTVAVLLCFLLGCAPARYVRVDVRSGTGSCECERGKGHVLCLSECTRDQCLRCEPRRG